jgi:hypothetical protein
MRERVDNLWILVKYMDIKNVFEYITSRGSVLHGLYIGSDDEGTIDYDFEIPFIKYDVSLDAIAPVVHKFFKDVEELLDKGTNKSFLLKEIVAEIQKANGSLDIKLTYPLVLKGIKILNENG